MLTPTYESSKEREEIESSDKDKPRLMKMTPPLLACVVSGERMSDRKWVRSDCRAENPERGRRVKVRFLGINKINRMRRNKV